MRAILSATIVALAACSGLAQSDEVIREGSGDRREALNAMELSAFDRSLLDGLTEWTGEPIKADDLDGKPLLILTWASWHTGSTASARMAEQMAKTFADKGLVVLGVHSDEGYDTAAQTAERLRLSYPVARDEGTKFRAGIRADMDPNFYVVDRAGQLRFADITRTSVRDALRIVTDETREQAAGAMARRSDSNEPASRVIASVAEHDAANIPNWSIPPQDVTLYQDANWPARWLAAETQAGADFENRGRTELPIVDFNTELVNWLGPKPTLDGRVRVVYYWAHTIGGSYERVQPYMDELQRRHGRDIAVIGMAEPILTIDRREARRNPTMLDDALNEFFKSLTAIVTRTQVKHSVAFDRQFEMYSSSLGKEIRGNDAVIQMAREFKYPIAVIYSTDNSVRWLGNPLNDRFEVALNRIVDLDPAVQIRRQRDEAYLARQNRR
ncbi:MAG: TlpA family protein disulfide reductase [Phycisphaera sp.]|nr:MAG: TlpA family protein disulfide reductase [Phycisphaera sp.]